VYFEDVEEYQVTVKRCPETGNVIEECWHHPNGEIGRIGAPARMAWDPHTFIKVLEEFWVGGMLGSPLSGEIPAQTKFDPITGEPTCRVWARYGDKHRVGDLPAVEFLKDGKLVRQEYWLDGQLYRQSGPPIVNLDPITGAIVSTADALPSGLQKIPSGYFPEPGI